MPSLRAVLIDFPPRAGAYRYRVPAPCAQHRDEVSSQPCRWRSRGARAPAPARATRLPSLMGQTGANKSGMSRLRQRGCRSDCRRDSQVVLLDARCPGGGGNDAPRRRIRWRRQGRAPRRAGTRRHALIGTAVLREQVDKDAEQPSRDHEGADSWRQGHDQPGGDLNAADDVHPVLAAAGNDVVHPLGQVVRPLDGPVEELVGAEEDRRDPVEINPGTARKSGA